MFENKVVATEKTISTTKNPNYINYRSLWLTNRTVLLTGGTTYVKQHPVADRT